MALSNYIFVSLNRESLLTMNHYVGLFNSFIGIHVFALLCK